MGIFDKLKGMVNAVTGGAAHVTLELSCVCAAAGAELPVRVTVTSTGSEIKSNGIFIDLVATERVRVQVRVPPSGSASHAPTHSNQRTEEETHITFEQHCQIAPPLALAPNETKVFETVIRVPAGVQPSYQGRQATHLWQIRGRLDAWGNDPDSGWQPLRIIVSN